jgi:amino acid transporter
VNLALTMFLAFWEFLNTKNGMMLILMLSVLIILWTLERKSRSSKSPFSWDALLVEDGQVSKPACLALGSFALMSWIMVYLTINDRLSEWYVSAYMLSFVAPSIVKIYKDRSQPTQPPPAT